MAGEQQSLAERLAVLLNDAAACAENDDVGLAIGYSTLAREEWERDLTEDSDACRGPLKAVEDREAHLNPEPSNA